MSHKFRHAICNEVFQNWPFADACKAIRKAGYTGIEIAPFTLAEDPATLTAAERKVARSAIEAEGLTFVGLHWIMVSPKGLHVTTPDTALREKSWLHIRNLIDLCADLGPDGIMVFGSPKQRGSTGGLTPAEATKHYVDGLVSVAPHAQDRGVTILIEALPVQDSDVVTSLDEAAMLVKQIGMPSIRTMFDVHNAVNETVPHAALIERHRNVIQHIHVNEMDGRHPGTANYDFKPVLAALQRQGYMGWVSLEAFDFTPGAETIANDSLRHLEAQIEELNR
ncbi:MAG: sugar phosphate isomerase/epimerase [Bryobacterales bacterium]|nr:sugar phosphate isomerase/epimerase [Bryobacterales bacterium]